jgi:2-polyprenyl-3-methyl-5-hydroxy-6-metoxy-1,4-benzoquinol methylase
MVVPEKALAPASWLVDNSDLLPRRGRVLDVACGKGRHALWMAARGFEVHAIDRDSDLIDAIDEIARRSQLRIRANVIDLETEPPPDLGGSEYDVVLGFNYLHRPLMPALVRALKPGGRIFYETFTIRQAELGHPRNPAFLLKDGELARLLAPLAVLRSREGEFDGRFLASIVAERLVA